MQFTVSTRFLFTIAFRVDEVSELNLAIGQAIDEMLNEGFLASVYLKTFGVATPTLADTCTSLAPSLDFIEHDSDLARVLRTGRIRVAYSVAALATPLISKDAAGKLVGSEVRLGHNFSCPNSKLNFDTSGSNTCSHRSIT